MEAYGGKFQTEFFRIDEFLATPDLTASVVSKIPREYSISFQDVTFSYEKKSVNPEYLIYCSGENSDCTRLPNGYDTIIGEGGSTISGGEKQRISIARALLKDAPIILLDEATASIDPENEQAIQTAISALIQSKTVIVIAHRLNTIQDADRIVVIDHEKVVEIGRHQELLAQKGMYFRMWSEQEKASRWTVSSEARLKNKDIYDRSVCYNERQNNLLILST